MTRVDRGFMLMTLQNRLQRLDSLKKQVDLETAEIMGIAQQIMDCLQNDGKEEENLGQQWLSPDEAGEILGVSGQAIRMHIKEFTYKKVGVRYMIRRDSVEKAQNTAPAV